MGSHAVAVVAVAADIGFLGDVAVAGVIETEGRVADAGGVGEATDAVVADVFIPADEVGAAVGEVAEPVVLVVVVHNAADLGRAQTGGGLLEDAVDGEAVAQLGLADLLRGIEAVGLPVDGGAAVVGDAVVVTAAGVDVFDAQSGGVGDVGDAAVAVVTQTGAIKLAVQRGVDALRAGEAVEAVAPVVAAVGLFFAELADTLGAGGVVFTQVEVPVRDQVVLVALEYTELIKTLWSSVHYNIY